MNKNFPGVEVIVQPVRGCGLRKEKGLYLRSEQGSKEGSLAATVVINPPIPTNRKSHRGPVVVDGHSILSRAPESMWLAGSSAARAEKQQGDQWAVSTFGMTLTKRVSLGECKGAKNPEEALDKLAGKVHWNKPKVSSVLREMALHGVQELPNMAGPYADLVRSVQSYHLQQTRGAIIGTVASIWRMADKVQPRHRKDVDSYLAMLLTELGLSKDAIAILCRS